jgi:lysophospholipase L1-like esterase
MQETVNRLPERAKWLVVGGITVGVLALATLAAEGAVRLRQTLKYGSATTVEDLYRVDEKINLRVPLANLDTGRIRTNSLGFRGPEIAVPKPPGVIRLAFLGASTTWCGEVSGNEAVWPHLVAAGLEKRFPGAKFDYVNGAVPGYTMNASLRNLEHRVASLAPDVIVIYEATNDMSGELRELAVQQGLLRDTRFEEQSWLARHSVLWDLAQKNLRVLLAQHESRRNTGRLQVDAASLGEGFRRNLTNLARAARQRAQVVAIATFSTHLRPDQDQETQLNAAASALFYMPFMTPTGLLTAYGRYNQIIREVAAAEGLVLIEGEFSIPGSPRYFTDSVHFTDAGSHAMADRVIGALAQAVPDVVAAAKRSPN